MNRTFRFYLLILLAFSFLVINLQNISYLYQHEVGNNLDRDDELKYNVHAAFSEVDYSKALDNLGINLHPGSSYKKESKSSESSLNYCKALVYRTLVSLPDDHRGHLQHLTLYFADGRRGLGGGSTVILRCSDVTNKELVSVLVHEMGHVVDTGLYTGTPRAGRSEFMDGNIPVYNDDLSLRFYRISWENETRMRPGAQKTDFVTGYAMTNPFEDFAETYNFYILHGNRFRQMAMYNNQLWRKYMFMKYYIFRGIEFDNDSSVEVDYFTRNYDSTILDYDINSFFGSSELIAELTTL